MKERLHLRSFDGRTLMPIAPWKCASRFASTLHKRSAHLGTDGGTRSVVIPYYKSFPRLLM